MRENSIERRARGALIPARGFTLPELVIVMILAGLMAAFALPKFDAALSLRNDAWKDQVQAAMRYAQKTAVSHRRLVCATVTTTSITLTISTTRGAACSAGLAGPGGGLVESSDSSDVTVTLSPSGVIYFQPDGRATSDEAGSTATTRTFSFTGASSLVLYGETGYVE